MKNLVVQDPEKPAMIPRHGATALLRFGKTIPENFDRYGRKKVIFIEILLEEFRGIPGTVH